MLSRLNSAVGIGQRKVVPTVSRFSSAMGTVQPKAMPTVLSSQSLGNFGSSVFFLKCFNPRVKSTGNRCIISDLVAGVFDVACAQLCGGLPGLLD